MTILFLKLDKMPEIFFNIIFSIAKDLPILDIKICKSGYE